MLTLTKIIEDELYRLTKVAVDGRNLPSAAVLLDESGQPLVYLPSRVASDKHALMHADLQVINEGCKLRQSISLRGCSVISVFEPSLMTISACYWASITEIAYIVPAAPFVAQIPWASEGITLEKKVEIAGQFLEPVRVTKLEDIGSRFRQVCDQYLDRVVSKN